VLFLEVLQAFCWNVISRDVAKGGGDWCERHGWQIPLTEQTTLIQSRTTQVYETKHVACFVRLSN